MARRRVGDPVLLEWLPDWVLVRGEAATVKPTALCDHHSRVAISQVEAGLRSVNRANSIPGQMTHVVTDQVSALLFAPRILVRSSG